MIRAREQEAKVAKNLGWVDVKRIITGSPRQGGTRNSYEQLTFNLGDPTIFVIGMLRREVVSMKMDMKVLFLTLFLALSVSTAFCRKEWPSIKRRP